MSAIERMLRQAGFGDEVDVGVLYPVSNREVIVSGRDGLCEIGEQAAQATGWVLIDQGHGIFSLFHPSSRFLQETDVGIDAKGDRKWWVTAAVHA